LTNPLLHRMGAEMLTGTAEHLGMRTGGVRQSNTAGIKDAERVLAWSRWLGARRGWFAGSLANG
jgi:hypothetical protein